MLITLQSFNASDKLGGDLEGRQLEERQKRGCQMFNLFQLMSSACISLLNTLNAHYMVHSIIALLEFWI